MPEAPNDLNPLTKTMQGTGVPEATPVSQLRITVLLMEANRAQLLHLGAVLAGENYQVLSVCDLRELFMLRNFQAVALVLLSDTIGHFALRASAETTRRQWPAARILVQGHASSILEDHLYDASVKHHCEPRELLDAMAKLIQDPWQQRSRKGPFAAGLRSTPLESDPTKAIRTHSSAEERSRETPGGARRMRQAG